MSHKKHRTHIKVGKDAEEEEDEAITSPVTFEMSIGEPGASCNKTN